MLVIQMVDTLTVQVNLIAGVIIVVKILMLHKLVLQFCVQFSIVNALCMCVFHSINW